MKKAITLLICILIVQITMSVSFSLIKTDYSSSPSASPLLGSHIDVANKIVIEEKETTLILSKVENKWILPELYDFPVAASKQKNFMKMMTALMSGWSVAFTKDAAKRFKVDKDVFEKKISFFEGTKELATVFVGSSTGLRKVYMRNSAEESIYEVEFSSYAASSKPDDWLDKSILNLPETDIVQAEFPSLALYLNEGLLKMDDLKENEKMNTSEVEKLLSQLSRLSYKSVLGIKEIPEYNQKSPELIFILELESGKRTTYTYSKPKYDDYVLKTSEYPYFFKVESDMVGRLKNINRSILVTKKEPVEKKESKDSSTKVDPAKPEFTDQDKQQD